MTQPIDSSEPALLFIYGTLKRGHCRAPLLAGQQFLETTRTSPIYRLFNCGTYPGLVRAEDDDGLAVEGEVWKVDKDCLALLDEEEGVDVGLYERAAVELQGGPRHVQGYLYPHDVGTLTDCGNCWTLKLERNTP